MYAEFDRLRQMSPNHQVVVWAGNAITTAYNARVAALNDKAKRPVASPGPTRGVANGALARGPHPPHRSHPGGDDVQRAPDMHVAAGQAVPRAHVKSPVHDVSHLHAAVQSTPPPHE
jgi:hypothetical protein